MYSSYSYGYNDAATGIFAGMSVGMMLVSIAVSVFELVCMWKIFVKAGEGGWKCLIPVYNLYVYMKICWEAKYFIYLILGIVGAVIIVAVGAAGNSGGLAGFALVLVIALCIAISVLAIISMVKLARRFGKSGGFAVGLIFLSPVFYAILAFDNSNYDRSRTNPGYVGTGSSSGSDSGNDAGNDPWH